MHLADRGNAVGTDDAEASRSWRLWRSCGCCGPRPPAFSGRADVAEDLLEPTDRDEIHQVPESAPLHDLGDHWCGAADDHLPPVGLDPSGDRDQLPEGEAGDEGQLPRIDHHPRRPAGEHPRRESLEIRLGREARGAAESQHHAVAEGLHLARKGRLGHRRTLANRHRRGNGNAAPASRRIGVGTSDPLPKGPDCADTFLKMPPLLVHLGLHRTGSSWLQQRVFDGREGRPRQVVPDRAESARRIVLPREDDFRPEEVRRWIEARTGEVVAAGGVPVLSNERFSGNPHSGWFDAERTFARLAEVVEEPRVLVVLRRQDDLVRSLYLQYVRIGGPASLAAYLQPPEPGDHRAPGFDPAFLRYDLLLDRLDRTFGRERVLALTYDLLHRDPQAFLDRIGAMLGTRIPAPADARRRVYASPGFVEAACRRRLNFWCTPSSLHRAAPFRSRAIAAPAELLARGVAAAATPILETPLARRAGRLVARRLEACGGFRDGNRRLAERIGEDLAALGWAV